MYPSLAPTFLVVVTNREELLAEGTREIKVSSGELGPPNCAGRSSCYFPHDVFTSTMYHRDLFSLSCDDMKQFGVGWVRSMGAPGCHFASTG